MTRILLADDEGDFRRAAAEALRDAGYAVEEFASADEAAGRLQGETFDIVLTDLRMPGRGGLDLIREAAVRSPDAAFLVLTAYGSLETAIEALRAGVHDFLLKPIRLDYLVRKVGFYAGHQRALDENRYLRRLLHVEPSATGLVGVSDAVAEIHRKIARIAPQDTTVLVIGETGTGKELVSRAIHESGPRRDRPFVAVNCGSIPETLLESELFGHVRGSFTGADRDKRGLFEVADTGTLLLDEIGELPLTLQPKLLRAIEGREFLRVGSTSPVPFRARIVAATHRDLKTMIASGRFRADLYYRLNVFEIRIPSLRERPQDIGPIASHLLRRLCGARGRPVPALTREALRALERNPWPGNVRELANVLERAIILSDGVQIGLEDLGGIEPAPAAATGEDLRSARMRFEREHIRAVLSRCGGDKARAAEALGIDLSSLYRKLQE